MASRKALTSTMAVLALLTATSSAAVSLAELVQSAKKDRTVRVAINSELGAKGIQRLRNEIKDEFGVDLDIRYTPVGSYPKRLADLIAENAAGIPASYDLTQLSDNVLAQARRANVLEPVGWRELLTRDTLSHAVIEAYNALHLYDSYIGMIYNADVIRDEQAPKKFRDLADPKWKDKLTAAFYTSNYVTYAHVLGAETVVAALQGAMNNNAVFDSYSANLSRFTTGEYPIQLTSSGYLASARKKGVNAKWVSLDVSMNTTHAAVVPKGARNGAGAKLIAVYLASPKGNKILQQLSDVGNAAYAGHLAHEITANDRKAGLKPYSPLSDPAAMKFLLSEEGRALDKKIGTIIFRR